MKTGNPLNMKEDMRMRKIAKSIFRMIAWRLSTAGIHFLIYYLVKENTNSPSINEDSEVEIIGYNVGQLYDDPEEEFGDLEERVTQIQNWFKMKEPIFIAYKNNRKIGFLTLKTKDIKIFGKKIYLGKEFYYLNYVYVSNEHRGKGIAGLLRRQAFSEMRKNGGDLCISYIDAMNEPAMLAANKTGAQMLSINIALLLGRVRKKVLFSIPLYNLRNEGEN